MSGSKVSPGRGLVVAAFVAVAVLGGCLSGDDEVEPETAPVAEEAEQAQVSETTGSIKGTVSSDLFEPLGAAVVTIIETSASTTVALNGEFTINNVAPGRYTLFTTAVGYQSASGAVEVRAGEVTGVQITLRPLASDDPYVDAWDVAGTISNSVIWHVEPPGVGCIIIPAPVLDIKSCGGLGGGSHTHEFVNVTADVMTHIVELVWDPAGPLGEYLALDYMCEDVPRGNGGAVLDDKHPCYFADPEAKSPLGIRVDHAHQETNGYTWEGDWASRIFANYGMLGTYDLTGVDAGVAYQQKFTYYFTVFHKAAAPEGYSGIPDA